MLVDDEQQIRTALAQMLIAGRVELVGEAANAEDAIELMLDLRHDVVLIDIKLTGISSVHAIERLGLLAPASRVLVLTRSEENRVIEELLAGASGHILQGAPPKRSSPPSGQPPPANRCSLPNRRELLQRIRDREIPITANGQAPPMRFAPPSSPPERTRGTGPDTLSPDGCSPNSSHTSRAIDVVAIGAKEASQHP